MLAARVVFAVAGLTLLAYGAFQLITHVPPPLLLTVVLWLVAVLLVHDVIIAPSVVGLGWVIGRVPPRGRRYLQTGLIVAAMITVVAIPLMVRQGTQPPAKAMLLQNYPLHWLLLLVGVAVVLGAAYVIRRARDQRAAVPST